MPFSATIVFTPRCACSLAVLVLAPFWLRYGYEDSHVCAAGLINGDRKSGLIEGNNCIRAKMVGSVRGAICSARHVYPLYDTCCVVGACGVVVYE